VDRKEVRLDFSRNPIDIRMLLLHLRKCGLGRSAAWIACGSSVHREDVRERAIGGVFVNLKSESLIDPLFALRYGI
jgi:hypothetical protein